MKKLILTTLLTSTTLLATNVAQMKNLEGKSIGVINVDIKNSKLFVSGLVKGLKSNTVHGFHIHQVGECKGDFKSAKGHYDPTESKKHSHMKNMKGHFGDLGNITTDSLGNSSFSKEKEIMIKSKVNLKCRSIIIHKGRDDLKSQPSGNAGKRIACGVIM